MSEQGERRFITITVPYTTETSGFPPGWSITRGDDKNQFIGAVVGDGKAVLLSHADIGAAVLAAWPGEPKAAPAVVKGYVVQVNFEGHSDFLWRVSDGCFTGCPREKRTTFSTLSEAIQAHRMPKSPPADVRIFAVAEDGTETPLPSYEGALTEISGANTVLTLVGQPPDGRPLILRITDAMGAAGDKIREAHAEIERLGAAATKATEFRETVRRLITSVNLDTTSGDRAGLTCDEEPLRALMNIFEAEREAERIIPGLVCAECDGRIYRGERYAGKGGHAAHWSCRVWPVGTEFKVAGSTATGAAR